jgi:hypothetical protein
MLMELQEAEQQLRNFQREDWKHPRGQTRDRPSSCGLLSLRWAPPQRPELWSLPARRKGGPPHAGRLLRVHSRGREVHVAVSLTARSNIISIKSILTDICDRQPV